MVILYVIHLAAGVGLLLNLGDSAHRVYAWAMDHSPYGAGRGFSPFVVRVAGLGVAAAATTMLVESLG
ncbi:hypothetical protein AB0F32_25065 [Streptomyces albidoflavus]|uniref:Uncharacterized protein n=1 Tax=Streptomyces wadayamensis TaxID=141454 RepID=A0ABR4SDE8_9ACTN|nr:MULTISPECIES: hypothetical protein [Streptomyces]KDR62419.1 hypothetical protein DC60_02665 [Streptomyces wadayamensis]KUL57520.1 hypothetical protein ADL32_25040 [Streptomyces albidoflavus]MCO6750344.1 hypothetical protein [Streptomyces sp. IpFD-1.1]QXQ25038.1 hypothetical protein STALF2_10115 [Streptomyces albidoflavus]QXQ30964.1 hypothetical protein STALF4_10145 [Streptomyces albidoflavus]